MLKKINVGDLVDITELRSGYTAIYNQAEVLNVTEKSLVIKDRRGCRQVVPKGKIYRIERCTYITKVLGGAL